MTTQNPTWTVGHAADRTSTPTQFIAANVPGAVQLDWARAHDWAPYWYADNHKQYDWMEDVFWTYKATLDFSGKPADADAWFRCEGIDYSWEILLNDQLLESREGMFSPILINLSQHDAKSGDTLSVVIHPIPKKHRNKPDRWQADQTCKPPCAYGWDWHPRLVPSGIWDETVIEFRKKSRFVETSITYDLDLEQCAAELNTAVEVSDPGDLSLQFTLETPDGKTCIDETLELDDVFAAFSVSLADLTLWWPHDHGTPALYKATLTLRDSRGEQIDFKTQRIGFRQARLVMNPEEWTRPSVFPKSRTLPPITLEINGRSIFAKGSNWVPPEIFPGIITRETYLPLLELAKSNNMNLLRCWGGGIVNKESFYELCDEMGIMVWSEFTLACLPYEDDMDYLEVLEQESNAIIHRVRQHASNVLWCGGNELFNSWSGMTDQSKALRLLNAQCYDLDPEIPFLPTAPVEGMGHGHYVFRDYANNEVYDILLKANCTAYTEFGIPGPASVEILKSIIPAEDLWPPRDGTAWRSHHAYGAWVFMPGTWLSEYVLEHYFGPSPDLETYVARSQWLQAEGFKFIFEESRRQKPHCSMALNWSLNEPWPTAACCSVINWPAKPKPALAAIGAACRPTCVSARIPKFQWQNNETIDFEVWLLNDRYAPIPAATIQYTLEIGSYKKTVNLWQFPGLDEENSNIQGPSFTAKLPKIDGVIDFQIHLTSPEHPEWNQSYRLAYKNDWVQPLYGPAARRAMNS